jgi:arylsulfatase A-like enzyme
VEIAGECGGDPGREVALCQQEDWFDFESGSAELTGPVQTHEAFFLADRARRWIEATGDRPWFLRVDTWGPHPPYLVGEPFNRLFDNASIGLPDNFHHDLAGRPWHHRGYRDYWIGTLNLDEAGWLRMYRRAVEHVVQVESALCALVEKLDLDQTLVVFNSDHGDAVGSNGGVANKGGLMAEATMEIPLYLAGAGLPAGELRNHLVSNMDLGPTVADCCGLSIDRPLHGKSLLPILKDPARSWRKGLLTQHYGLHQPIVQRAWYEGGWKLVLQPDGYRELYQLSVDPGEMQNLAGLPGVEARENHMLEAVHQAMDVYGDRGFSASVARSP